MTATNPRASFASAYDTYATSNSKTRGDLWTLCEVTYDETKPTNPHKKTFRQLADSIGFDESRDDSISDWAKVGWLIEYTKDAAYEYDLGVYYVLSDLWHGSDNLSYDHLLRAAKLAKRHEIAPDEVLTRLYLAMDGRQYAETMERDIEEAHEKQDILLRRDIARIGKRLKQNIDSLEFRGVSRRLVLAFRILERRMKQELERLESAK